MVSASPARTSHVVLWRALAGDTRFCIASSAMGGLVGEVLCRATGPRRLLRAVVLPHEVQTPLGLACPLVLLQVFPAKAPGRTWLAGEEAVEVAVHELRAQRQPAGVQGNFLCALRGSVPGGHMCRQAKGWAKPRDSPLVLPKFGDCPLVLPPGLTPPQCDRCGAWTCARR